MDLMVKALEELPEQTRRIFVLNRLENKTRREIAAMLDVSQQKVDYHINKANEHLFRKLKDYLPFLVLFLDSMRDELGGSPANLSSHDLSLCRTSLSTPIDQCVGFILKSSMKCENCESYHYLYQRTTILSICVPIGQPSSLEECLKMYFSESAGFAAILFHRLAGNRNTGSSTHSTSRPHNFLR